LYKSNCNSEIQQRVVAYIPYVPFIFALQPTLMKKLLSLRVAATGILLILSFIIIFHLLVISGVIPANIVWGGNVADQKKLWLMESISILVNIILLLFVGAYAGIIKVKMNAAVIKTGFWIMFVVFTLNTAGNLLAKNPLETYLFTPLTLLLSVFCLRIAAFRTTA
jgi:hypothetical protein